VQTEKPEAERDESKGNSPRPRSTRCGIELSAAVQDTEEAPRTWMAMRRDKVGYVELERVPDAAAADGKDDENEGHRQGDGRCPLEPGGLAIFSAA